MILELVYEVKIYFEFAKFEVTHLNEIFFILLYSSSHKINCHGVHCNFFLF